jgi:hypothetical protein
MVWCESIGKNGSAAGFLPPRPFCRSAMPAVFESSLTSQKHTFYLVISAKKGPQSSGAAGSLLFTKLKFREEVCALS